MPGGVRCTLRMALGTYAIDDEPFGLPYVPAGDGRYRVSGGLQGTFVLPSGDVVGAVPVSDLARRSGCCGPHGMDGPNLECAGCGALVATEPRTAWQEVRLYPDSVRAEGVETA